MNFFSFHQLTPFCKSIFAKIEYVFVLFTKSTLPLPPARRAKHLHRFLLSFLFRHREGWDGGDGALCHLWGGGGWKLVIVTPSRHMRAQRAWGCGARAARRACDMPGSSKQAQQQQPSSCKQHRTSGVEVALEAWSVVKGRRRRPLIHHYGQVGG